MSPKELSIRRINALPKADVLVAIQQATSHVEMKLHFRRRGDRTLSGAHSEANLGMPAVAFYVGEVIRRLFDPNGGWIWKFDELTLGQQLCRIADKLMSDVVAKWKNDEDERDILNATTGKDLSQVPANSHDTNKNDLCDKIVQIAFQVSEDDTELTDFCLRFFDDKDYDTIATEMNLPISRVYAIRKKLVLRMKKYELELREDSGNYGF